MIVHEIGVCGVKEHGSALPGLRSRLEEIVALGNRFAGTEGEERARTYLLEKFDKAGLARVRMEEFPYLGYEPVSSRCSSVGDDLVLPSAPLEYTADATREGEAVYLGAGQPEDFEIVARRGVELAGKIVVAHTSFPFLLAPELVERKPAALVNIAETPDGLVGAFTAALYPPPIEPPWEGRPLPFPGVSVEAEAGRRLLARMTLGPVRLRVEHRARYRDAVSANVVGELEGHAEPAKKVVIGAHYDTQLEGPGAADNATGLAALLEMASEWRGEQPRRTVVFAAWGVEELGIWGSHDYVLRHRDEWDDIVAMVNLDAMGLPFPGRRVIVGDPSLTDFANEAARMAGWEAEETLDAGALPFGDYAPFLDAGIPAAWLWLHPPQHPYYHSAGDILRYVDVRRLHDTAVASARVVSELANRPNLQIGRAKTAHVWSQALAQVRKGKGTSS